MYLPELKHAATQEMEAGNREVLTQRWQLLLFLNGNGKTRVFI